MHHASPQFMMNTFPFMQNLTDQKKRNCLTPKVSLKPDKHNINISLYMISVRLIIQSLTRKSPKVYLIFQVANIMKYN